MELTAGILAGGKSSRMGQDKALLKTEGETFLERSLKLFGSMEEFGELLVSATEKKEYEEICTRARKQVGAAGKHVGLVLDGRQGYGPLEGVYRLLQASQNEWVFVAAVDMPCISREAVRYMLRCEREGAQAVLPQTQGRIHPLFGLYAKSTIPAIEEMFRQEVHKMGRMQEWISVKKVELSEGGLPETVLSNVNTPLEYEKMLQR